MGSLGFDDLKEQNRYVGGGVFERGRPAWNRGIKNTPEHTAKVRDSLEIYYTKKELEGEYRPWHDRDWLNNEYWTLGRSFVDIGKEYSVDSKRIKRWAQLHGIPARNQSEAILNAYKFGRATSPTGEKSHNWKGGRGESSGYRWVTAGGGKVKFEHVAVAERALGRSLKKNECVHHINMNKLDNRNSNLLICDRNYHKQLHWRMEVAYAREHFGG